MNQDNYKKYQDAFTPSDNLSEKHLKDWLKSGVNESIVNELGVRTSVAGDSWVIPIWNVDKTQIHGYIARYDNEAINKNRYPSKDGVTPKYRPGPELGNRFFYPHIKDINWKNISEDTNQNIGMTEGIKKAVKLTLEGLPTIGLFGVWNWLGKEKGNSGESE